MLFFLYKTQHEDASKTINVLIYIQYRCVFAIHSIRQSNARLELRGMIYTYVTIIIEKKRPKTILKKQ